MFKDCLASSHGSRRPLICVLRGDPVVLDEIMEPLLTNFYYGESGSLISELESRLPREGPIYKNENAVVWMRIEESSRGTSVESKIKYFSRHNDGRATFQYLM